MDKISVFPEKVRSGGNVLSPKDTTDFELVDATLTKSSIVIDDVTRDIFYLQSAVWGAVSLAITDASTGTATNSVVIGTSVVLTATVDDGNPVSGASVIFKVNGVQVGTTQTTDSSGVASYTYTTDTAGSLTVAAECENYSTGVNYLTVNKHVSAITMAIADSSIAIGESFRLSGYFTVDGVAARNTIKIYQDNVLVATAGPSSEGYWISDIVASSVGTTVFKAVFDETDTIASSMTSDYTCTVSRKSSNLNITVPAIVYSDEFDVTGVLTDDASTPNPISGASVKLKWEVGGVEYESSAETTDSNGEVTFHRSAPTSITTYKFWLVYDGDSTYANSTSSEVSKTVGKETTVLSVSSPSNNASYDGGDSVTVSGTLLTNDSEKLPSGTVVYIKEGTTTLGTASVSTSDGSFSTTISNLSDGSHTLTIEYEESTNYLGSSVTRTVTLVPDASVSTVTLSTDKSILSYEDRESATLTATALTSQNVGVPNQSVMFYTGSPILATQFNSGDWTTVSGNPVFSDNGVTLSDIDVIAYSTDIFDLTTDSYRIYLTATKDSNSSEYLWLEILTENYGGNGTMVKINDSTITFLESSGISTPSGLGDTIDVCIEFTPTAQKLYINGSQVATGSMDYSSGSYDLQNYLILATDSNETCTLTNLGVYDSVGDEFIASDITDSNGVAEVEYQSKDTSSISIKATCNNVESSSINIQNYNYYDASSSSNLSKYTVPSTIDMIYDSTEQAYKLKTNQNAKLTPAINSNNFSNTRTVQADIKLLSGQNVQAKFGLYNGENGIVTRIIRTNGNATYFTIDNHSYTSEVSNLAISNPAIQYNTWYTVRLEFNGTSITSKLIYNGNVIATLTATSSVLSASNNKLGLCIQNDINDSCYIKNIIVE